MNTQSAKQFALSYVLPVVAEMNTARAAGDAETARLAAEELEAIAMNDDSAFVRQCAHKALAARTNGPVSCKVIPLR